MGHSSITVTLDRYGHLFPGSDQEAADLLDAYLAGSLAARLVALSHFGQGGPEKLPSAWSPVRFALGPSNDRERARRAGIRAG
jgi:hypothetical protein